MRYFWYIIRIVYSVLGGSEEQTQCLTATGRSDGASHVSSLYATQSRVAPLWLFCRWHHKRPETILRVFRFDQVVAAHQLYSSEHPLWAYQRQWPVRHQIHSEAGWWKRCASNDNPLKSSWKLRHSQFVCVGLSCCSPVSKSSALICQICRGEFFWFQTTASTCFEAQWQAVQRLRTLHIRYKRLSNDHSLYNKPPW